MGASTVVVGAGPAGLTTALQLARRGDDVTVIESSAQVGGMAGSREIDGLRVDLGSHRLHPVASDRVELLLQELLGDDLQTRPRNGRLRLGDRWVRFPLSPVDLARSLPPRFVVAAIGDTVLRPFRAMRRRADPDDAATFADVVTAGLGPAMLDWFYGPYARKLWGRPASELSGDLARRRIAASSAGRLLVKVARAVKPRPIVFRYPRLGYGQVVERLAEACVAAGVEIQLSTLVSSTTVGATHVHLGLDDDSTLVADRVFWSAPPSVLADLLRDGRHRRPVDPAPDAPIRHRGMVLAYLSYDGEPVTPFDAHYLPGPESIATRLSEPRNYRDGPDPDGRTVLCAEIPCDPGDRWWSAAPDELSARLQQDLSELGLTDRTPAAVEVIRLSHVYPVVGPGEEAAIEEFHRWAATVPGITVLGRQGLVVADNLHHVMDMGFDAAACLVGGVWDDDAWNAALERFSAHVVED